jgi:hypothetical protein
MRGTVALRRLAVDSSYLASADARRRRSDQVPRNAGSTRSANRSRRSANAPVPHLERLSSRARATG